MSISEATEQDFKVLKSIVSDFKAANDFVNVYDQNLFADNLQQFVKTSIQYIKNYKSVPTRKVLLESHSSDEAFCQTINGVWDRIESTDSTVVEFKYDLEKLKKRFTNSKMQDLKSLLDSASYDDYNKNIKIIQNELDKIKKVQTGTKGAYVQKTLRSYMPEFKEKFTAKVNNPELGKGIMTGYSFLDFVKNGMRPSEMLVIGAETGGGKSQMLNNMAVQMWMQQNTIFTNPSEYTQGYNVMYFSLEMPYELCSYRTLACLAEVPTYGIRDAKLSPPDAIRLSKADKFIKNYPYEFEIIDIPRGTTVEDIERRFEDACNKYQPHIIVVDYLGLLEDHSLQGDDWLKLGLIAGKLHEIARSCNVVMLTAVQLNRMPQKKNAKEEEESKIGLHRIGRSSLVMHHASVAIQIETRRDERTYSDLKYHVIKNRDGELGYDTIKKDWSRALLKDLKKYEPPASETVSDTNDSSTVEDLSAALKEIGWY